MAERPAFAPPDHGGEREFAPVHNNRFGTAWRAWPSMKPRRTCWLELTESLLVEDMDDAGPP